MAKSDVNRLLILPAIVLAAALSLTGCANLPFGGDDNSSNNSSNNKNDKDDEDEEEEEEEEEEASGSSNCPQEFLDKTKQQGDAAGTGLENLTITEIDPADFKPAAIGSELDGGCVFTIQYTLEGTDSVFYQAFVPGGQDLQDSINSALVDGGYEVSTDGFYTGTDGDYVIVLDQDESEATPQQIQEQGLGFLGSEFLVISAYEVQV
jgi:hypothetical protein